MTQPTPYSVHVELFREQDVGSTELCDVLENASGRKRLLLVLDLTFRREREENVG